MSLRRLLSISFFVIPILFTSCIIRSLNGTVVYDGLKKKKKAVAKKEEGMRKPKISLIKPAEGEPALYAGLRRSSYGLPKRNNADAWWAIRAKEFAASITTHVKGIDFVQPVIIQIVSGYKGDGATSLGFKRPKEYTKSDAGIFFNPNSDIDHENALSTYDKHGVKAIIQFESGNSDILTNLEIAHLAFGHHPCIIGYGIDAEWYFTKESKDETGLPLEDENVEKWMEKVLSFNPKYTLFLKHWDPVHMPQKYRHPSLWFLSDSQIFPDLDSLLDDFSYWAHSHKGQVVGYQYGYPKDKKWWKNMDKPTVEIGLRILEDIPNTRFLFWVDFTADEVDFN